MRKHLSRLGFASLLVLMTFSSGCVEDIVGTDSELSVVAAGPPTASKLSRAKSHALGFWRGRIHMIGSTDACVQNAAFSTYRDPNLGSLAGSGGCAMDMNGQPGVIGFNTAYRWTYPRVCVAMVHATGRLYGLPLGDSRFRVMSSRPHIGDGNCPT